MFKSGLYFLTSQTLCVCVCARARACVLTQSCSVLWTVASQAPLSMEFSRLKYWSVMPFPPPGDLPNPGIKRTSWSLALAGGFFTHLGNPLARLSDTDYLTFFKPHFHIYKVGVAVPPSSQGCYGNLKIGIGNVLTVHDTSQQIRW